MGEKALRRYLAYEEIMKMTALFLERNTTLMIQKVLDNLSEDNTLSIIEKNLNNQFQWIISHTKDDSVPLTKLNSNNKELYLKMYNNLSSYIYSPEISNKIKELINNSFKKEDIHNSEFEKVQTTLKEYFGEISKKYL